MRLRISKGSTVRRVAGVMLQWGPSLAAEDMEKRKTKMKTYTRLQWGPSLAAEDIIRRRARRRNSTSFNGAPALRLRILKSVMTKYLTPEASMGPQPCG